jgi:hypothetical protein
VPSPIISEKSKPRRRARNANRAGGGASVRAAVFFLDFPHPGNPTNFVRQRIDTSRLPATLAAKWSRSVLTEGFVPFPKQLLRCLPKIFTGTGAIEKLAVILAIVDFQRDELFRDPSLEYLAFTAGMDSDDFQTIMSSLEKEGLISVEETDTGLRISLKGLLEKIETHTKR